MCKDLIRAAYFVIGRRCRVYSDWMQVQGYIEPYGMQDKEGHFLNAYWKCAHYASLDPITAAERTQLRQPQSQLGKDEREEPSSRRGAGSKSDESSSEEHVAPVFFLATDNPVPPQRTPIPSLFP